MDNPVDKPRCFHIEHSAVALPAEVSHFLHTLSTGSAHSYEHPHLYVAQEDGVLLHRKGHALLLLLFLRYLRTEEGQAFLSTLPLEASEVFTGVPASLNAVLAVGHFIRRMYESAVQE